MWDDVADIWGGGFALDRLAAGLAMPDVTRRILRSDDELAHRNAEQVLQSGVVESGVVSIRLKMSVFKLFGPAVSIEGQTSD